MKYSVIILLEERNEGFPQFLRVLYQIFSSQKEPFEILIMANGTEGFLKNELEKVQDINNRLKAFALNKKASQAVCLKAALKESSGQIIVVCGSYQQITSDSFDRLLERLDDGADIISPWRQNRVDPFFNQFQSKVFNALVRKITKSGLHDLSNTVRIFRRKVLEETEVYGNMYRFLPITASQKGFKYREVKCEHYQEQGKTGFYALSEYLNRILDIFTLYFTTGFTRKPLRFFSSIGFIFLIFGIMITSSVFMQKIFMNHPIGGRPILLLAILFMVLGVQAASVGLLGEIITFTHGRQKKEYTIEKTI
jgi:glycosyltransferase involved in cell wall biosynthesis